MDTALDKLTSWALRNTFEIPDEPWHEGLDFDRGQYVAGLPEGEMAVQKNIEELREQVENMRKLNHGLMLADRTVGKKVKALQKQKEAIGFITALANDVGIVSLPQTAREITAQMDTLHATLSTEFETVVPVPAPAPNQTDPFATSTAPPGSSSGGGAGGGTFTREWEFGRAAYLSWAVSRARALVDESGKQGAEDAAMDVDHDDLLPTTTTTETKKDVDGEQKRLEELLAITRGVSGGAAAGGAVSGTMTGPTDGVKGMGWALHGLLKNDAGTAGGGDGGGETGNG